MSVTYREGDCNFLIASTDRDTELVKNAHKIDQLHYNNDSSPSKFVVNLHKNYNCKRIFLTSCRIPLAIYNVETRQVCELSDTSGTYSFEIFPGYYTMPELASAIENQLNLVTAKPGETYFFSYDPQVFRFKGRNFTNGIWGLRFPRKLCTLLGFNKTRMTMTGPIPEHHYAQWSANTNIRDAYIIMNLSLNRKGGERPRHINLESEPAISGGLLQEQEASLSGFSFYIPRNANNGTWLTYEPNCPQSIEVNEPFSSLEVELLDMDKQPLKLRAEWSFTLRLAY